MLSVAPSDHFVQANHLQLHYRRWNGSTTPSKLPPILLLHGLASVASIWNLVAPLLAARGYDVIALDQRGHGQSDKPTQGYDFASILADDLAFSQALNLAQPVLIGHSWGAMAALEYAAAPASEVSALVLVDGASQQLSHRPGWSLEQALIDLAPPRYTGVTRDTFLSFFARSPLASQWTPELEEIVLQILNLHLDGTVSPRLTFENHLQIIEAMWDQPTIELYARVRCPLKLVVAEQTATDEQSKQQLAMRNASLAEIQTLCPEAQIVHMVNTIHDIPLQRPDALAAEILALLPT